LQHQTRQCAHMDWVLTLLGQLKAEVSTIFMVTHWHYKTV